MPSIVHGIMTSIFVVLTFGLSPFEFIVRHFLWLLLAFWLICAVNSLFYYPILLLVVGPEAEVVPLQYINRISTPSPQMKKIHPKQKSITVSNKRLCKRDTHHCHLKNSNAANNEPSLTTITEEPQFWQSSISSAASNGNMSDAGSSCYEGSSLRNNRCRAPVQPQTHQPIQQQPQKQSIIVQPELTVETHHNGDRGENTKVIATANIKVELVTTSSGTSFYSSSNEEAANAPTTTTSATFINNLKPTNEQR